jgi:hypothetical protein
VRVFAIWLVIGLPGCLSVASAQPCSEEVTRIAALDGASQRQALRSLLSGSFLADHESLGCLFYYSSRLRPPLRALIRDPKFGEQALALLTLIGEPTDRPLLLLRPASQSRSNNRWVYGVVCAMLYPTSPFE